MKADKFINIMLKINRYNIGEVFEDLLNIYISMNSMGKMEELYHSVIKKYEKKEIDVFVALVSELILEYEENVRQKISFDILGDIYQEISSKYKNSALGQFFTPIHVTDLISLIVEIDTNEYPFMQEPAVGSGRCVISAFNKNRNLITSAIDKDYLCVKMCIVNMHLYKMVGSEVLHGDAIEGTMYKGFRIGLAYPEVQNMFGKVWDSLDKEVQEQLLEINKLPTMCILPIEKDEIIQFSSKYFIYLRKQILEKEEHKKNKGDFIERLKLVLDDFQGFNQIEVSEQKSEIIDTTIEEIQVNKETEIITQEIEVIENKKITFEFKKKKGFDNQVSLFDI